jgi:ferredoxin
MDQLRIRAKELLESKQVAVVIGYAEGSAKGVRAFFARSAVDADRLIYDKRCTQNLAVYLLKHEVRKLGRMAIVAALPVLRSILQLAAECQLAEKDIVVLGIGAGDKLQEFPTFTAIEEFVAASPLDLTPEEKAKVEEIRKLPLAERWQYWQEQLARCFKCYACRAACPMCYCTRCTTDCNQPQWIPVPAHDLGNLEWHVMRAMHLAGRCVNCGECSRACPLDIPLFLLNQMLIETVQEKFGLRAGTATELHYALSTFKPDDKENFIR